MSAVRRLALIPALLALLTFAAACSEGDLSSEPIAEETLSLQLELQTESWGTTAPMGHSLIRVRAIGSGGAELRRLNLSHSGALSRVFGPFEIEVGSEPVTLERVEVEVVGGPDQDRVLWSGVGHDLTLTPGSVGQVSLTLYPTGVESRELSAISIESPFTELGIGEEFALNVSGQGGSVEDAFWGSLDPQVAWVGGDGRIRGLGTGTARIVVAAGLRADTLTISTRERAEEIRIDLDSLHFTYLREARPLSVEVIDFRGDPISNPSVEWSSTASGVVQVDQDGRARARGAGSAEVAARVGTRSASIPATVVQVPDHVLILPVTVGVQLGQTLTLNASVRDRGGERIASESVSLSIEDSSVAAIEDGQRIRGVSPGQTTLTVTGAGLERETDVTVSAGDPAAMQLVSGGGQTGVVGTSLDNPIRVRVIDGSGFPVPGVAPQWTAQGGGAAEAFGPATSNSEGELFVRWKLDGTAGPQELSATTGDVDPLVVRATGLAGPPVELILVSGSDQEGVVATPLAEPVVVEAHDGFGNTVPDLNLTWAASAGGAISPSSPTTTGSEGRSSVEWTVGTQAGTQSLRVNVEGVEDSVDELVLTAGALPGPPAAIQVTPAVLSMSADETRTVNAQVVDAYGNPVSGQAVSWSSDDENVVEVTPTGATVQAVWEGQTQVRATSGTIEGTATVEVAEILPNGGFEENDGEGSSGFAQWTVLNDPQAAFPRNWYVHDSGTAPHRGLAVPSGPQGTFAALVSQMSPGYSLLYREVYIPQAAETLEFEILYDNAHGVFYTPDTFAASQGADPDNQQFRVDLMTPGSGPLDFGPAILMNVFRTESGDPLTSGGAFVTVSVDVSGLQGQTVRLRFGEAVNYNHLTVAIDDVRLVPGF